MSTSAQKPKNINTTPKRVTPNAGEERFMTSPQFAEKRYDRRWLVHSVLLPGQPAVVGGPKKCLKTSLAIDLAISLGTGKKFLGHFAVPEPVRVAVISGESGGDVLQETARRIADSKKVRLRDADVLWSFELPRLGSKSDLARLHDDLREAGTKLVVIDPLYLCLLGGTSAASASNLFEVGPLLRNAARACLTAGATPVLVHHTTKAAAKESGPLGLEHLAFAGIAEFARQWVLINRKEQYLPGSGEHHLAMVAEGSAGHSGCWDVRVREGVLNEDLGGKYWSARVSDASRGGATSAFPRVIGGH